MRVYLDHAASTPLAPAAAEAMAPWLAAHGNPSSLHAEGRAAKAALDASRETLAEALGAEFDQVSFTGGGAEAVALPILSLAFGAPPDRRRILMGAAEHRCVLDLAPALARLGFETELVPVDRFARLRLDALEATLADDVLLLAMSAANNELGTLQPVADAAASTRASGALLVCDFVQAFRRYEPGGTPETLEATGADVLCVSAHKVGGPAGVGAFATRPGLRLKAPGGGSQERGRRAGTENVAGIVGFAAAVRAPSRAAGRRAARAAFEGSLRGASLSVPPEVPAVPGICHLRFPGVDAETLLLRLDREGVGAGAGAACASGALEPSHVLLAAGWPAERALEGARFSFGDETGSEEARWAGETVSRVAAELLRLRGAAPAG